MSKPFWPELRLFLIRHGEAIANREKAFLGRRDDPLTSAGLDQVKQLTCKLAGECFDGLYTSPLQRALTTAQMIAHERPLEPIIADGLIEQDFGEWDGHRVASILSATPDIFRNWRESGPELAPPGGESLVQVGNRVQDWFNHIRDQHPSGQTIALVGHGSAFQALLCRLFQIPLRPLWPFKLALGSVTEVHFNHDQPSLIRLSA